MMEGPGGRLSWMHISEAGLGEDDKGEGRRDVCEKKKRKRRNGGRGVFIPWQ